MTSAARQTAAEREATPGEAMVTVSDLTVRFVTREGTVAAVNGVDFEIREGEVLGILGESGSGKSVTLRAMLGLHPPKATRMSGSIRIGEREIVGAPESVMSKLRGSEIAMIFQEPSIALDPVFTIGEQISEALRRHRGMSRRAGWKRARELLELVQIPSPERRLAAYPHEMSGGMRQRAMIALALACDPPLLLADEPTTALDVTVQMQIILLLRDLQRQLGMTVAFVTHDVGVAVEIADRIAVMYAGRIVESGPTPEVIDRPRHPYTIGLLSSTVHGAARGERLEPVPGLPPDLRALPPGCSFAPRCRFAIDKCLEAVPPLEAVGRDHEARCIRWREVAEAVETGTVTTPGKVNHA